ncbi:MAG: HRDC domain-containing protein [Planctomycetaceae bacterium]|jgi:ribonuclease D|nr:HRDC domain-containing protein [Planctomycetaceae bacterium]
MAHLTVSTTKELRELCSRLQPAEAIAYDTEFISEGKYQPELCLVQIAAEGVVALVDPLTIPDLSPLWKLFCDGKREIIVHASRSEMEFCHRSIGRMPPKLFDVQVAAGFVGNDYPMGFSSLLKHFLHVSLRKTESRTTWNLRPLTPIQIEYALDDVRYLEALRRVIKTQLIEQERLDWYYEEIEQIKQNFQTYFETPQWRSLPKISGLPPRELAILRELWFWRDEMARQRNIPASRAFRDDLLVELSRRRTSEEKRIAALRGMQRQDLARILPDIVVAISRGLALEEHELPLPPLRTSYPQYTVLSQVLYAVLGSICKQNRIAPLLVGSPNDIRELIAAELGTLPETVAPRLATGWRNSLIGTLLYDLLHGRKSLQINYNSADEPLVVR